MEIDQKIEYNYYPVDLGLDWKNLYNSDGNKPDDGANKRQIFAQNAAPTSNYKAGDLWFDADDNNTIYRANAALSWVSVKDGTIAGKTTTFRQAGIPTSLAAGDLWYDSDDGDKQYRAAAAGATTIAAGAWIRVDVGANPTLIDALATTNAPAEAGATVGANWSTNLSNIPEIRGWSHNLVFSVTDADTVAWAAASLYLPSGTTYTIDAGNTDNMAAKTYVYFDKAVSQTVLQTTTTASNAVGTNKILIAVCQNSITEAVFQVFGGIGGLNIKGADIETGSITTNEILANTIVAGDIAAGTITSAEIGATNLIAQHVLAPSNFTAGEDLTAGDTAYFKVSDGKIWKAITTGDESTYNFIGFVRTTVASGATNAQIITGGIITKAAWGLTAGSWYYLSGTAGAISTTPGTRVLEVGIAISTTELLIIQRKPRQASGNLTLAATNTSTITIGFRPTHIIAFSRSTAANGVCTGFGDGVNNNCTWYSSTITNEMRTDVAWFFKNSSAETVSGVIDTLSATGFRFNQSINNIAGGSTTSILWMAWG